MSRRSLWQWALDGVAGVCLLGVLAMIAAAPLRTFHDNIIFLAMGRSLLGGAVPYVDFFEINFPLIMYLSIIPVVIADLLAVNPVPVSVIMVYALVLGAAGVSRFLLARYVAPFGRPLASIVTLGFALHTVSVYLLYEYGQREHIFILLYFPWFLLRWIRWRDTGSVQPVHPALAVMLGVLAGIGLCIKPHYLIISAAVELFWLITRRDARRLLRPEVIACGVFGLAYAAHFFLVPDMLARYMEILRFVSQGGYRAYGDHQPLDLVFRQLSLVILGLMPFAIQREPDTPALDLTRALGILILSSVLTYELQGRGLWYHLVPGVFGAVQLVGIEVMRRSDLGLSGLRQPPSADSAMKLANTAGVVAACVLLVGAFLWRSKLTPATIGTLRQVYSDPDIAEVITANSQEGDRIFVASTSLALYGTAIQTGRDITPYIGADVVYMSLFGVEEPTEAYRPEYAVHPEVSQYLAQIGQDIAAYEPSLIILDDHEGRIGLPKTFSLADFLQSRGFVAQHITPAYIQAGRQAGFIFYRRVGNPPGLLEQPVRFGDTLSLAAWQIDPGSQVEPCQSLTVRSWWEAAAEIDAVYSLSVVLTSSGQGVSQQDGPPASLATTEWAPGGRYADQRTLQVPCGLAPGEYPLLMTIYHPDTLEKLPVTYADGGHIGEYFYLTTLTVAGD